MTRTGGATHIRLARDADAEPMLGIYAPFVETSPITFETVVPSAEEFAGRVRTVLARWPWLVLELRGIVAGYAYASSWRSRAAYQWAVETTVYVDAVARRQGVGRALYRSLLACLRLQGHRLAIGAITLPNPSSVALHESLGYRCAGVHRACGFKLGAWHDVGFWECEVAPRDDREPAEPVAPGALVGSPDWERALASGLAA